MFETILAFCLMVGKNGEMANPCWMIREERYFETMEICIKYAEQREAMVANELIMTYEKSPVVSVQCGPVTEGT